MLSAALAVTAGPVAADPRPPGWSSFPVGEVWSGTDVKLGVVGDERTAYVAYFDKDRKLTLARIDLETGAIDRASLGRVFEGFNSHHELVLHKSVSGDLHFSGDMHVTPLVYGSMRFGAPAGEFRLSNRMTGLGEKSATYPRFYDRADGALVFIYRDGSSGHGATRIKIQDARGWRDAPTPLFDGTQGERRSSAYFGEIVKAPDGSVGIGWNWRYTSNVATNSDILYARSRDFEHWTTQWGEPLKTPIGVGSKATVVSIPPGGGLQNPPAVSYDRQGGPLLAFASNDREGRAQIFVARPEGQREWSVRAVTDWTDKLENSGIGSRPKLIRYREVIPRRDGGYLVQLAKEGLGSCQLGLDDDMRPTGCRSVGEGAARPPTPAVLRTLPAGFGLMRLPANTPTGSSPSNMWLVWAAQQSPGDLRPECTAARPAACDPPPMPLTLFVQQR